MHLPQSKMIELRGVSVDYNGYRALCDVDMTVDEGDFVAITGPNGGGKTTLLKVILQLIKPTSGTVNFRSSGALVTSLKIGYLPQKNMIDSRFPITVEDVVLSGLLGGKGIFHRFSGEEHAKVDAMLEVVGMTDKRKSAIGELSGGQLQRTLLGRAVISNPDIVVLDEPLSYVDHAFVEQIYGIVADLAKRSTVVLVSHEMTVISEMANRHWIVDHALHQCHAAHHYLKTECDR